jgi:hypothetical protein
MHRRDGGGESDNRSLRTCAGNWEVLAGHRSQDIRITAVKSRNACRHCIVVRPSTLTGSSEKSPRKIKDGDDERPRALILLERSLLDVEGRELHRNGRAAV